VIVSQNANKPDFKTRLMAVVCACCPFCIARRAWPDSAYGRFMKEAERNCPFCQAYSRLHANRSDVG